MPQQQQDSPILHKGDEILWRGCYGKDLPRPAKVSDITLVENPRTLDGSSVEAVPWSACDGRQVVVDLNNGRWAYGFQLCPKDVPNG